MATIPKTPKTIPAILFIVIRVCIVNFLRKRFMSEERMYHQEHAPRKSPRRIVTFKSVPNCSPLLPTKTLVAPKAPTKMTMPMGFERVRKNIERASPTRPLFEIFGCGTPLMCLCCTGSKGFRKKI